MALEKYTTTVVGAHSLPRWYEILEKQVEAEAMSMEDMRDAQTCASQAALLDEEAALEANNACFEGIRAFRWEHVCQGNYAVGEDYDGQIGHRYFDIEPYPTGLICQLEVDAIMNEGDMPPSTRGSSGTSSSRSVSRTCKI